MCSCRLALVLEEISCLLSKIEPRLGAASSAVPFTRPTSRSSLQPHSPPFRFFQSLITPTRITPIPTPKPTNKPDYSLARRVHASRTAVNHQNCIISSLVLRPATDPEMTGNHRPRVQTRPWLDTAEHSSHRYRSDSQKSQRSKGIHLLPRTRKLAMALRRNSDGRERGLHILVLSAVKIGIIHDEVEAEHRSPDVS